MVKRAPSPTMQLKRCHSYTPSALAASVLIKFLLLLNAQSVPPISLLEEIRTVSGSDYFRDTNARVYRYPDAPGQSLEELVKCYRQQHQECGDNRHSPCDPDDDASPVAGAWWDNASVSGCSPVLVVTLKCPVQVEGSWFQ